MGTCSSVSSRCDFEGEIDYKRLSPEQKRAHELAITSVALLAISALLLGVGSFLMGYGVSPKILAAGFGFAYSFAGTHLAAISAMVFVGAVIFGLMSCLQTQDSQGIKVNVAVDAAGSQ